VALRLALRAGYTETLAHYGICLGVAWFEYCMAHVVLLGDSIFDNFRASLAARDGARIADVAPQVDRIAPDATHFVVSVGGNDALDQLGVLQERTNSLAAALNRLATIREGFEAGYRSMLERVLARGLPTAICTIYYPRFPEPAMQRLAITGFSIIASFANLLGRTRR
jgi:lysophospholipase L1-like esterase